MSNQPKVTGLAYQFDGLVLLTNDGLFAETLASAQPGYGDLGD